MVSLREDLFGVVEQLAKSLVFLLRDFVPSWLGVFLRQVLPSEQREQKREKETQDDRGCKGKIEREVATLDDEVAGKAKDRHADHDDQPEGGDGEADQDERLTHGPHRRGRGGRGGTRRDGNAFGLCVLCGLCG